MSNELLEKIKPKTRVALESAGVSVEELENYGFEELIKLPGIGAARAKEIVNAKNGITFEDKLTTRQEKFCEAFTSNNIELFGNGTQAYLEVYGQTDETGKSISYMTAAANASRLLKSAKVIERVNELLETGGFNEENVDKQHLFLINQNADLKTKMAAIKEYNSLKKRTETPKEQTFNFLQVIQNVISEPGRSIIDTGFGGAGEEAEESEVEDAEPVLDSEQGRGEDSVQAEQAPDLITGELT